MGKASARKRSSKHDPATGRFEAPSPLNDPALRDYAIKTFRAIEQLEPMFHLMIKEGDFDQVRLASAVGFVLSGIKENIRDQLSIDKQALRDAVKPELRAARLYPSLGIADAVAHYVAHPIHVFTYEGKPIVQVNTKAWRNALKRAGIEDFRWHDLRHTFATWHREAGTPTHELQRLGGWKTQSMVERYAHVAPEGLQFAASRLDNLLAVTRQ